MRTGKSVHGSSAVIILLKGILLNGNPIAFITTVNYSKWYPHEKRFNYKQNWDTSNIIVFERIFTISLISLQVGLLRRWLRVNYFVRRDFQTTNLM